MTTKTKSSRNLGASVGLLVLRLVFGSLMMGHGAQKLFGWFGGPGMNGTTAWLGSMGMRPPKFWALLAGLSEFGGGLLMALGFLNPIGPLLAFGAMAMATVKAHLGKPIWASQGGLEFPLTNMAIASALMAHGPGDLSLDGATGLRLPRWLVIPGLLGVALTVAYSSFGQQFPELQAKVVGGLRSTLQTAQQVKQLAASQTTARTQSQTQAPSANGASAAAAGQTPSTPRP